MIASAHPGESQVLADWLASDGFEPVPVSSLMAAQREVQTRSFDLLISDAGFAFQDGLHAIGRERMRNPQTPLVVVGDGDSPARSHAERRQAMFLERPVDRATLLCYVTMAAGEARPARRSQRKSVGHFEALVDGSPSYLVDVSNEGLRLETPRNRVSTPPPYFAVKVPMVGLTLMVQRVWTNGVTTGGKPLTLYGAALAYNPDKIEKAWRRFVDAVPQIRP